MRRLVAAREHLDGPLTDPGVLDGNLRDLRRVNRQFGGTDLSVRALRGLVSAAAGAPAEPLRVLDVGAGACDMALAFIDAAGPWRSVEVTALDSRQEVLEAARRVEPRLSTEARIRLVLGDGRALPFRDGEFDVVHASLVVHHLDGDAMVEFLRELARVSRLGIVVNDLERGVLNWLGAWLVLHAMTRNAFTLHDGPLSVRRSPTLAELRALLRDAGLRSVTEARGFAGHRWAVGAVPAR